MPNWTYNSLKVRDKSQEEGKYLEKEGTDEEKGTLC